MRGMNLRMLKDTFSPDVNHVQVSSDTFVLQLNQLDGLRWNLTNNKERWTNAVSTLI